MKGVILGAVKGVETPETRLLVRIRHYYITRLDQVLDLYGKPKKKKKKKRFQINVFNG